MNSLEVRHPRWVSNKSKCNIAYILHFDLHEQHNTVAKIVLTADGKSEVLFFSLVLY